MYFQTQSGANRSDRDDFLSEAAILGQFSDPNVITIEGVVLKGSCSLLFCGDLDLKKDSNMMRDNGFFFYKGIPIVMLYTIS